MAQEIVEMAAFTVIGIGVDCPGFDASGIGAAWDTFAARRGELPEGSCWGVSLPRENGYYYLAGQQVLPGTAVPEGMETARVPSARYLRVDFDEHPSQMPAAFRRLFAEVLPAAGLQHAPGPVCLEDYPPGFMDEAAGLFHIHLYVQLAP